MENKRKIKNNTVATVLLLAASLLLSFLLWTYVTETRGEDIDRTYYGVEVVFDGESVIRESRELIVSETSANYVDVTLTGNRRTLYSLESADLTVVIDLTKITRTGSYAYAPRISYPTRTDTNAISHAVTNPETISFYVDKLDKRTVNVTGSFTGSAAEGFVVGPLQFSPSTIILYGPENVLDQVARAYVEDVQRSDLTETTSFESTFVLLDADGNKFESDEITFSTETVNVTVPISATKTVPLDAGSFIYGGGINNEEDARRYVRITPDPAEVTVTLTGDADSLATYNRVPLPEIDLTTGEDHFKKTYSIDDYIPNGAAITGGATDVELTVEIVGLSKKTFTIDKSQIIPLYVSEGYEAEIGNDFLRVTVRGTDEALRTLSDRSIRVEVDLTEYGNTTVSTSVPVRIMIDGTSGAGVVGDYEVLVNIREATEEENGSSLAS